MKLAKISGIFSLSVLPPEKSNFWQKKVSCSHFAAPNERRHEWVRCYVNIHHVPLQIIIFNFSLSACECARDRMSKREREIEREGENRNGENITIFEWETERERKKTAKQERKGRHQRVSRCEQEMGGLLSINKWLYMLLRGEKCNFLWISPFCVCTPEASLKRYAVCVRKSGIRNLS